MLSYRNAYVWACSYLTLASITALGTSKPVDTSVLHPAPISGSTASGHRVPKTVNPYVRREAEDWDLAYGITVNPCSSPACDSYIGNINNGDFIVYAAMDFEGGATGIQLMAAADVAKSDEVGTLHLHVDNITNNPFASLIIGNTGDLESFVSITQFIEYPPAGVHDLFFSFSTQYGTRDIGNIDWFQFYKVETSSWPSSSSPSRADPVQPSTGVANRDAFARIQASEWDYNKGISNSKCQDKCTCDSYAGYIQRDDALGYYGVDFQGGATGLQMALGANVANGDITGTIYFHLDSISSNPFATVVTGNTAGEQVWVEVRQFIEYAPQGLHDLYFTFSAATGSDIGNIAWFQFYRV